MPRCPVCDFDNPFGALICARCYKLLVPGDLPPSGTTLPRPPWTNRPDGKTTEWETQPTPVPYLGSNPQDAPSLGSQDVNLIIGQESLVVRVTMPIILGRYAPSTPTQPRIDLNPFGAIEKGVSRMHAAIKRTDIGLSVEDLSSSNGTWLNETRLQPYTPQALYPGDRLRLSQLTMQIMFHAAAR